MIADLDSPSASEPTRRLATLQALLDICIQSYAQPCLFEYAPKYLETAAAIAPVEGPERRMLALRAGFYIDAARASLGSPDVSGRILDGETWKLESVSDVGLYLRRQALAANILLEQDRYKEAGDRADKILSLVATLRQPQSARLDAACVLSDTIATLLASGQTERAYGIYAASAGFIVQTLPPLSVDAVAFHLVEAQLLQETGRLAASATALDLVVAALAQMELDADVSDWLLGRALTLKAAVCVLASDQACAQAALARHPSAALQAKAIKPTSYDEVTYLAARALVGAVAGVPDPAVAQALKQPIAVQGSPSVRAAADTYRLAGYALALPPGPARQQALHRLGPRIVRTVEQEPSGAFAAWRKVGAIEQLLIALALGQPGADKAMPDFEVAFALSQLAGRSGQAFDADAFTLLAQARDEPQRRAIHQALRLKARRDQLERGDLQKMAALAKSAAPNDGGRVHDGHQRLVFRDFADQIGQADGALAAAGVATSGVNLIKLSAFQAVLGPDEAALFMVPLAGDVVAYMCIRRDAVQRRVAKADLQRAQIDARVVRAGLTAGHAPSEALDSQFPVEASMRLYDVLVRPFASCLKPGDRIIWLSDLSTFSLPLSVLLEHAPPKAATGPGYDLAAADWLVRRHAVSYPGSAAMVVAARSGRGSAAADFDFLGIGNPLLTASAGQGGVDLSGLAALPETKAELEDSARGFRTSRLLMQNQATERDFRAQLVGSYRFLSFATHGLLREDLPGVSEPALVLTPAIGGDPSNDGLLTVSEIADLNLAARFVALSACNTANYDLTRFSQDLPALASAFAVAGVPSTLATLWPVDSETSKRVVVASFAHLRARDGADATDALAQAQRAYLAAPPSKAHLHPRFWAPFVLLGDGAATRSVAPVGPSLAGTDVVTHGGGEVIDVIRSGDGVITHFIAEPKAEGGRGSALQLSAAGTKVWQQDSAGVGASKPLLSRGALVLAGGYRRRADGTFAPTLQSFDAKSGRDLGLWAGDASAGRDSITVAGTDLASDRAIIVAVEQDFRGAPPAAGLSIQAFEIVDGGAPRQLFVSRAPPGLVIHETTVTRLGENILLTYATRYGPQRRNGSDSQDDYDQRACPSAPVTWIELRDAITGERRGLKQLDGYLIVAAEAVDGDQVLLGGAVAGDCVQGRRAVVLSLDAGLQITPTYVDATLGISEVRALAKTAGGVLVAAAKENVLDYQRPSPAGPARRSERGTYYSGMLVALTLDGKASTPKMLDSGGNIFLGSIAVADGEETLVGGALGGEAAVFRLSATPPAPW